MLKIIGMLCVLAACTLFGRDTAKAYAQRPLQIRLLLQGLQYLETEIVFACTPLPVAFYQAGEKLNGAVGKLFMTVASLLQEKPDMSPKEAWEIAYKQNKAFMFFKPQDEAIINAFTSGLGQSHREEQLKQLRLVQELLKAELTKSLDDSKKFVKMYNTLGVSVGLVLVILLF